MSPCSFAGLRKDAQALLALINTLPQREWEKRLHGISVRDPVLGPLAVGWLCQQMMKACPHQSAPFWCEQIDACKHAARVGHKVRCSLRYESLRGLHASWLLSPPSFTSVQQRACPVLCHLVFCLRWRKAPCTNALCAPLTDAGASGRPSKRAGGTQDSP